MRRTPGIYILTLAALLPLGWLIATSSSNLSGTGAMVIGGAVVTVAVLLRYAWNAHFRGRFLANTCNTCDSPMRRTHPGELKPPPGTALQGALWRCDRCGRLEGARAKGEGSPPAKGSGEADESDRGTGGTRDES